MKLTEFEIKSNELIARDVYEMTLEGDASDITRAGQFVNIKTEGLFLRRPISVCDVEGDLLTIVYKVVGKGTQKLSEMREGKLNVLTGLGNGYDLEKAGDSPVLIGGGVGVPPLYLAAKRLGGKCKVLLGFNESADAFYVDKFEALGAQVKVATVDGSLGTKGYVTDLIDFEPSYFYACGPYPMLNAVSKRLNFKGEVSMEERMGCGFGACMGCTIETKSGFRRVCKEGPVFCAEEIIWKN